MVPILLLFVCISHTPLYSSLQKRNKLYSDLLFDPYEGGICLKNAYHFNREEIDPYLYGPIFWANKKKVQWRDGYKHSRQKMNGFKAIISHVQPLKINDIKNIFPKLFKKLKKRNDYSKDRYNQYHFTHLYLWQDYDEKIHSRLTENELKNAIQLVLLNIPQEILKPKKIIQIWGMAWFEHWIISIEKVTELPKPTKKFKEWDLYYPSS